MIKMPLFGSKKQSPLDIVKGVRDSVAALEKGEKKSEKVCHLCPSDAI